MKCSYDENAPEEFQCKIEAMANTNMCTYHYAYWAYETLKPRLQLAEKFLREMTNDTFEFNPWTVVKSSQAKAAEKCLKEMELI